MPNSIKSPKQFRFLEMKAHSKKPNTMMKSAGPSKGVAQQMLSDEDPKRKKKLAMGKKP